MANVPSPAGGYALHAGSGASLQGRYTFDRKTGDLRDTAAGTVGTLSGDMVAQGGLPRAGGGNRDLRCITASQDDVMVAMQRPENEGAWFVIPALAHGAVYPGIGGLVRKIEEYKHDKSSAGARAQLAVHPAVGQFLIDNASNESRRKGISTTDALVSEAQDAGLHLEVVNGFLQMPHSLTEKDVNTFSNCLHWLRILAVEGVPACGLTPDLYDFTPAEHRVNLVYGSAVSMQRAGLSSSLLHQQAARAFLAAQYYGALKTAAQDGSRARVFLLGLGDGALGNPLEVVAAGLSLAVEMLGSEERSLLDMRLLCPDGDELEQLLFRFGKIRRSRVRAAGYGPDGQLHTGYGSFGPDGMPLLPGTEALWTPRTPRKDGEASEGEESPPGPGGGGHTARRPTLEADAEGGHGWFRAEDNRAEQEQRAAQNVAAICSAVNQLWQMGGCPSRRWTNCRAMCDAPGLPENVPDFAPTDDSLLVPQPSIHGRGSGNRPEVGDRARVVQENSPGHFDQARMGTRGKLGRVVARGGAPPGVPPVKVELPEGQCFQYEEDWLAVDRGRATKGDKVRIYVENGEEAFVKARVGTRGLVGTVLVDYGPGPRAYQVVLPDGRTLPYDEDMVARVAQPPHVGDVVRIMVDSPNGHFDSTRLGTQGLVGTVLTDDGTDLPFLLDFGNGLRLYYAVDWVHKVAPELLRLSAPPGSEDEVFQATGDYVCEAQEEEGGYPVWVKTPVVSFGARAGFWYRLRSDRRGRWRVTRMPDKADMLVSRPHNGRYPQLVATWGVIRAASFLPVELVIQALISVPGRPPPPRPPPPPPKRKPSACGQCVKCADGCCPGATRRPAAQAASPPPLGYVDPPEHEHRPAPAPGRLPESAPEGPPLRKWARLVDYGPSSGPGCSGAAALFNEGSRKTHCGRVFQSRLDNAYFVEALNAITLRPRLVRRLFYSWSVDFSVYAVRLFKNGTWICVEIDDWVPAKKSSEEEGDLDHPCCCYSEWFPEVLWPSLVEKAYAKACTLRVTDEGGEDVHSGGWGAIGGGGRVDEALVDLTGGVASRFSARDVAPDRLFIYLYELQRDCLFVCRVHLATCQRNGVTLQPFAHYAVNRAAHHEGDCFVQLFCSAESGVHTGGLDQLTVPEALMSIYPEREADGFFWMSIYDFQLYFDTVFECRLTNSPDVGIVGMPPSRLHAGRPPTLAAPLDMRAPKIELRTEPPPYGLAMASAARAGGFTPGWPPPGWQHPGGGLPLMSLPGQPPMPPHLGIMGIVPGAPPVRPGMAVLVPRTLKATPAAPVPDPADEKPIFFESVFATDRVVTEHSPPEFDLILPNTPCEVVAAVEQTCTRISQVGQTRRRHPAVLLKVYEKLPGDNVYSSQVVCKSNWMPVRGAMVAFKAWGGGTYKVMVEMLQGERCDRLIFRCYSSAPSVQVKPSWGMRRHLLAKPPGPSSAVKWTFVGCVPPERLARADLPMAPEDDMDALRRKQHQETCCLM